MAAPAPKEADSSGQDALLLRVLAIAAVLGTPVALVLVLTDAFGLRRSTTWTAVPLIWAAIGLSIASYLWALAELHSSQRSLSWAWRLSGAVRATLGAAAVGIAVTNQWSHWLGGAGWTIALVVLGGFWLFLALGDFRLARR